MSIKKLDWDSVFFGLCIGRAEVTSFEEVRALESQSTSIKSSYDLVYIFASHELNVSLLNAKLVDEKVVYSISDIICGKNDPNVVLWSPDLGVTDDLLHLALVSGKYSRFRKDENFLSGSYERLYTRWIEQSVNHAIASEVFCYMVDDTPRGLVTLNNTEGYATIGLVAIHEDFQNRGIGHAMIQHVIHYARIQHFKKLSVATQLDNKPACKLYEKNGFTVESVTDVLHWWM